MPGESGGESHGIFEFSDRSDSTCDVIVDWSRVDDAVRHVPLVPTWIRGWASRRPAEPGGRGWRFDCFGDTLVGQLVEPRTHIVTQEFFATRIR